MTYEDKTFRIKQGDSLPELHDGLRNADGTIPPLEVGLDQVKLHLVNEAGYIVFEKDGIIVDDDDDAAHVMYAWALGDTAELTEVDYYREWEVTYESSHVETFPNDRSGFKVIVTPQPQTLPEP